MLEARENNNNISHKDHAAGCAFLSSIQHHLHKAIDKHRSARDTMNALANLSDGERENRAMH